MRLFLLLLGFGAAALLPAAQAPTPDRLGLDPAFGPSFEGGDA